jgi:mannonate dehydratase
MAIRFDISVSNFGIQEYMRHTRQTDDVFAHACYFKDGYLHAGEATGLGVDYDENLAGKFPYQRAYLPVNRKLDGTIFNW